MSRTKHSKCSDATSTSSLKETRLRHPLLPDAYFGYALGRRSPDRVGNKQGSSERPWSTRPHRFRWPVYAISSSSEVRRLDREGHPRPRLGNDHSIKAEIGQVSFEYTVEEYCHRGNQMTVGTKALILRTKDETCRPAGMRIPENVPTNGYHGVDQQRHPQASSQNVRS